MKSINLIIHNNEYSIRFVGSTSKYLLMDDDKYHAGITDFYEKTIYINEDLQIDALKNTILHELTHAIIDSYGFMQVEWNDEIVADFMANYHDTIIELMEKINNELSKK